MHKPTAEEKSTFARALAVKLRTTPRQVRKMRQRGKETSQAVEMPRYWPDDQEADDREYRFRPRKINPNHWPKHTYGSPH